MTAPQKASKRPMRGDLGPCRYGKDAVHGGCDCERFRPRRAKKVKRGGRMCACGHDAWWHGKSEEATVGENSSTKTSVDVKTDKRLARVASAFDELRDAVIDALKADVLVERAKLAVAPPSLQLPEPGIIRQVMSKPLKIGGLNKCEQGLLSAIIRREPRSTTYSQACAMAGYRETGSTSVAIASLRTAGYVSGTGERLRSTEDGQRLWGQLPLPSIPDERQERIRFWKDEVLDSKCSRELFQAFADNYPREMEIKAVFELTNYKETGSTSIATARLRLLDLIEGDRGTGRAKATAFAVGDE